MSTDRITIEVKDLLPPKKAAEYLGVSVMTLWRWVRDGKITSVMLDHTYFHLNELNRIKAERRRDK
jgi:excisionase family DNA binding protein